MTFDNFATPSPKKPKDDTSFILPVPCGMGAGAKVSAGTQRFTGYAASSNDMTVHNYGCGNATGAGADAPWGTGYDSSLRGVRATHGGPYIPNRPDKTI